MKIWDSCGTYTVLNPDLVFAVMKREMLVWSMSWCKCTTLQFFFLFYCGVCIVVE